jgi:peptide/nickel transport system permease protein
MGQYIARRLLQAIPLLLIITFVLFGLIQEMGDPLSFYAGRGRIRPEDRARLMKQLGLDKPMAVRYLLWLRNMAIGNWGNSLSTRQPVISMIAQRLPNTLLLMIVAEIVTAVLSLFLGIYSALRQYSLFDNILTSLSLVGYSMPVFWLALVLIYVFGVYFKRWGLPYLPTGGVYDLSTGKTAGQVAWHMVLPVLTLSVPYLAGYTRYIRASMLEVIGQDYVRTARAKGLYEHTILYRHALKNAAIPFVTVMGLDLPFLLGGAIVTESIFAWPGMGRLFWEHAGKSDYPVLMAILLLISVSVVVFQIATDMCYSWLDPRIRYS